MNPTRVRPVIYQQKSATYIFNEINRFLAKDSVVDVVDSVVDVEVSDSVVDVKVVVLVDTLSDEFINVVDPP